MKKDFKIKMDKLKMPLKDFIAKYGLKFTIDDQVHQVRWLYHNSNKCTKVLDEKFARAVIDLQRQEIEQLKEELKQLEAVSN